MTCISADGLLHHATETQSVNRHWYDQFLWTQLGELTGTATHPVHCATSSIMNTSDVLWVPIFP